MKLILSILVALAGAIVLAKFALQDPGFVVLAWDPYTIKLPLLLFILILLLAFAAAYLLFNLVASLFRAPKKIGQWNERRTQRTIQNKTMQGYARLIEGEWSKAESALLSRLSDNRSPLINYLGAAYSAQQQGHHHHRDKYLDDALAKYPKQQLAIELTRARLLYQAGEIATSRECLEKLHKRFPKCVPVVRLLTDSYRDLGEWAALVKLAPTVQKMNAFSPEETEMREKMAFEQYLSQPKLVQGELENTWQSLSYSQKRTPRVVAGYARYLIHTGAMVQAEKLLRKAINRHFDSELAGLYAKAETDFITDQIKLAESWAKNHFEDQNLQLTLARLYRRNEEFERAQALLKQLISNGDKAKEACIELGGLLEQIGETEAAMICYRKGLALPTSDRLPTSSPSVTTGSEMVLLDTSEQPASGEALSVAR